MSGKPTLKPIAQTRHTFQTPILQVTASKPTTISQGALNRLSANAVSLPLIFIGNHLAVRTQNSTTLWEVASRSDNTSEIELIERVVLDNSDVGNRPIVDMKINSSPGVAVYVNDEGTVYKCDFGSGWKSL